MKLSRLWQPRRGLFWVRVGFNGISSLGAWPLRALPLEGGVVRRRGGTLAAELRRWAVGGLAVADAGAGGLMLRASVAARRSPWRLDKGGPAGV